MDLRPAPGKDCRLASGCPRISARSATRPPGRVHSWPRRERDQESVGSELDAADDALACAAAGSDPTGCGGFTFRESAARPPWRACAGLSGQRHFPFAIAHEEVTLAPAITCWWITSASDRGRRGFDLLLDLALCAISTWRAFGSLRSWSRRLGWWAVCPGHPDRTLSVVGFRSNSVASLLSGWGILISFGPRWAMPLVA